MHIYIGAPSLSINDKANTSAKEGQNNHICTRQVKQMSEVQNRFKFSIPILPFQKWLMAQKTVNMQDFIFTISSFAKIKN